MSAGEHLLFSISPLILPTAPRASDPPALTGNDCKGKGPCVLVPEVRSGSDQWKVTGHFPCHAALAIRERTAHSCRLTARDSAPPPPLPQPL